MIEIDDDGFVLKLVNPHGNGPALRVLAHQHGSDLLRVGGIFSLAIPWNAFLKPGCHFNTFLDNDRAGQYYQLMSKTTDDILNNALRLSTTERAELAAALLASLDGEPEDAVEAAWATEIQRRVERVRSGAAKGRPWPEVRERLERRRE
jgi:putative addiction module component (TIGR02574 family)